jgi:hypothetical protein
MTTVTLNALSNEAASTASPQLTAADAFLAHSGDLTLALADLTVAQLSAVVELMPCARPVRRCWHVGGSVLSGCRS